MINTVIDAMPFGIHELEPLHAGRQVCESGHSYGPHIRTCTLIHYVRSGRGKLYDSAGEHDVGAGQFFIIRPGEVTRYAADEADPWTYVWIGFTGTKTEAFRTLPSVVTYPNDTFLKLDRLILRGDTAYEIFLSILYELTYYLFAEERGNEPPVEKVKRYLDVNYMDDVKIEDVAKTLGFDRRYLSRVFTESFGVTPKEYLTAVRLQAAKDFLNLGYGVSESAVMAGYPDPFNFSKIFKKKTGLSPAEYRKKNRDRINRKE